MIISFSGRMGSGKTMLADTLVSQRGFKKFSFAEYLKEIISQLYQIPLEDFYNPALKNEKLIIPLPWNQSIFDKLMELVKIKNFDFQIKEQNFFSRREAMQFIGTEVLRKYNDNFHVQKTISLLQDNVNYVCDDVRYLNELNALKEKEAFCFFILRPSHQKISNHISETSVTWNDVDNHIINNKSANKINRHFIKRLDEMVLTLKSKNGGEYQIYKDSINKTLIYNNYNLLLASDQLKISKKELIKTTKKMFLGITSKNVWYDRTAFSQLDFKSAFYLGYFSILGTYTKKGIKLVSPYVENLEIFKKFVKSNKIIKSNDNKYTININCPYILENLKKWDIKSPNSKCNSIPELIKENPDLLYWWIFGMINASSNLSLHFIYSKLDQVTLKVPEETMWFIKNHIPKLDCNDAFLSYEAPSINFNFENIKPFLSAEKIAKLNE